MANKMNLDYIKPFGIGLKKSRSLTKTLSSMLGRAKGKKVKSPKEYTIKALMGPSMGFGIAKLVESLVKKYKEKKSKK